jgi:hypothetical protein
MKIAAGDTDNGLRLLAEASRRPQTGASATNPLENVNEPLKAEIVKPCKKGGVAQPKSAPERKVRRTEQVSDKVKPAPEPTLASLAAPAIAIPPTVYAPYGQDAMAYIPAAQREQLRMQRAEFDKAQRLRELELKRVMRHISHKYEVKVPSASDIQVQVERGLHTLAQ